MTACGSSRGEEFIETYSGEPYTGFVEVRVEPAGGKAWRQHGKGSAHFVGKEGGNAQLVVFGAIDDEDGDAGFAIDGTFEDGHWKSETDEVVLEVARDGRISGGGTIHPQKFGFSGSASETSFNLDVDIELLEGRPGALPAGSRFRFSYELSRAPRQEEDVVADAESHGKGKKKCRKIRYEMRPVANIGDGSMSMIQVPVCLQ